MTLERVSDPEHVAAYIAKRIRMQLLMGSRVLWLVPGGSGIAVAVETARTLVRAGVPLAGLTVTFTDERYGSVGHKDSNQAALEAAGFMLPDATFLPVLSGASREETARTWNAALANAFDDASYRIGLFGIGADGHTAGILPGSPAVESEALVAAYSAGAFERITLTPRAIATLDEAVAYATGESKWPTLATLLATNAPDSAQPAQVLKRVPHAILFSDYQS